MKQISEQNNVSWMMNLVGNSVKRGKSVVGCSDGTLYVFKSFLVLPQYCRLFVFDKDDAYIRVSLEIIFKVYDLQLLNPEWYLRGSKTSLYS